MAVGAVAVVNMADLLSPQDWQQFDDAIGDLFDTFANIPLTIRKKQRDYTGYDTGSESSKQYTDYTVRCLGVFDKEGNGAENDRMASGNIDLSEGYFLVYWNDLNEIGLIDQSENKPLINSSMDTGVFQNDEFVFIGHEQVGPFDDRYAVIKIHFKREMKSV